MQQTAKQKPDTQELKQAAEELAETLESTAEDLENFATNLEAQSELTPESAKQQSEKEAVLAQEKQTQAKIAEEFAEEQKEGAIAVINFSPTNVKNYFPPCHGFSQEYNMW